MDVKFKDVRFCSFNILEQGVRVHVEAQENFSEWEQQILHIARLPLQIPISFRAAFQIFMRLSQDASKYRNEYAVAELPQFREMIQSAGFHVQIEHTEIEFSPTEWESNGMSGPDAIEYYRQIQAWLVTDPADAVKKLGIEPYERLREVIQYKLSKSPA